MSTCTEPCNPDKKLGTAKLERELLIEFSNRCLPDIRTYEPDRTGGGREKNFVGLVWPNLIEPQTTELESAWIVRHEGMRNRLTQKNILWETDTRAARSCDRSMMFSHDSDLLSREESISRMAEHCHMTEIENTDYFARAAG